MKASFPRPSFVAPFLLSLAAASATAAQIGPQLPSHRYPTDRSFHLGYRFHMINSSANFVEPLVTDALLDDVSLRVFRHEFAPEFQPNRQLSVGARINFDSVSLNDALGGKSFSKSSLGDQTIFTEFRALDEPGSSLGFAAVVKVPAYSNPTLVELNATDDPSRTILFGDAQIDMSVLVTTEYWAGTNLRLRADTGYTSRFDGYASELPFMASVGVVNPKMDFEFRVRGNLALGSGTPNDFDSETIRKAFGNSDYAYSPNPWTLVLEPNVELWLSAKTAVTFHYSYSLMGNRAPAFHAMSAGLVYRWAETLNRPRRTFQEVPIETDQEAGKFEGESSGQFMDSDPVFEI